MQANWCQVANVHAVTLQGPGQRYAQILFCEGLLHVRRATTMVRAPLVAGPDQTGNGPDTDLQAVGKLFHSQFMLHFVRDLLLC